MKHPFALREISLAAAAVIGCTALAVGTDVATAAGKDPGKYVTGDFHNHTTCSDGQISVQKLVNKSVDTYGLDWFVMAGHGGGGTRNCLLVDDATVETPPSNPFVPGQGPSTSWADSIGIDKLKGDRAAQGYMFRWQSIQEFQYPVLEQMAAMKDKPIFIGLESVVPGHEHTDIAIIDGQLPAGGGGNATAMAQFEYCFDRADNDTSRGGGQGWDCSVPGSALNAEIDPTARKLVGTNPLENYNSGELGHLKSLEGVKWKAALFPNTSYHIPAHLERAGAFNPTSSRGFNVEHLRDYNNAGPTVAFGMEGGPGHQASGNRGGYGSGAIGGGTYGGMGFYTSQVGGVWDAMLGEGRNWFIYNNSDYHNRGSFGPDDARSTNDQYPGEYNKTYVLARTGNAKLTPQAIVDGMRSGNAYFVNGDLIDRMAFAVCTVNGKSQGKGSYPHEQQLARAAEQGEGFFNPNCAQQGEKLVIKPGQDVMVSVIVRDPEGENLSPYSFPNPSLIQPGVGISQPLNRPVLDHVDLIGGEVTGYRDPADREAYAGLINSKAATNPSAALMATFNEANWTALPGGWKRMSYRISGVQASQYLRLRGSNLPPAVPFETDSQGNPLLDPLAKAIPCADAACPAHMPVIDGQKRISNDVMAWADVWFYSNPVFIEVKGSTRVAGIK
ncbi:MAG: hypothetical protein H0W40_09995 [Methylibium sp.]|uniref:hypothetical protein n=1 Tax=Methylibium sp. TaxID=2067992 RepID=UPI0017A6163A|nr:hypothetical protein [Methylibium sp.]MBA3597695.1 hypothetical protein [Methylibium sp.]